MHFNLTCLKVSLAVEESSKGEYFKILNNTVHTSELNIDYIVIHNEYLNIMLQRFATEFVNRAFHVLIYVRIPVVSIMFAHPTDNSTYAKYNK